jgi:protein-tyrosine phosphatase
MGVRARWTAGAILNIADAASGKHSGSSSRIKEIAQGIGNLSPAIRDMLFDWNDPAPAIQEVTSTIAEQTKRIAQQSIRAVVPKTVIRDISLARQHGGPLVLALRRRHARQKSGNVSLPNPVRHVLFVCHGNIIRSAFSERLFAGVATAHGMTVSSAGLFAKQGNSADLRAIEAANKVFGIDLHTHAASPITAEHVEHADLICVMDRENEIGVLARFPDADRKVLLLGQFCPPSSSSHLINFEIPDPYRGEYDDVVRCYYSISDCMQGLMNRLGVTSSEVAN